MVVWWMYTLGGSTYGMHEVSSLRVYIESTGVLVLGCKIGSIYDKMIGFTVDTAYGIKLGIIENTGMCSLIGSSGRSRYVNLNDSFD